MINNELVMKMTTPNISTVWDTTNHLPSGRCNPKIVAKPWGEEQWFANGQYCSKLIKVLAGHQNSMHIHVKKHETLVVVRGLLYLDVIIQGISATNVILPFEAFTIAPGFPHRLRAVEEDVYLVESSTYCDDADSIRIG